MSSLSGPTVDTFSDATTLFVNKFVKVDTDVTDEDQASDFRRWKEQQIVDEKASGSARVQELEMEARRAADRRSLRQVKEESWQCCIDSGDRDTNLYPQPSSFSINMGQTFQNVIRARLISLEFPNVLNVVNKGHCTLTWINLEDVDLDFPVYSISIPTGNYNYRTLETQLNNQLHSSALKRRNGLGTPHFFLVKLDGETDKVSFSSIIPQATGDNPIQTIKDTNRVRVTAKSHGFVTGDTVRVLGAQGALGGISPSELNGAFVVTVPVINGVSSNDFFEYEVANVARGGSSSNLSGGGKSVQIGKEAPFQFTFQHDPTNASSLLGFPSENSSLEIPYSYLQTYTIPVDEVLTGETTLIVARDHRLMVGDRIYLNDFVVSPSIYSSITHRGEFYVHRVISPDVFEIDFASTYISDVSSATIGTRIVTMCLPGHGFNRIVELSCQASGKTLVETLIPHNVAVGQTLFIRCMLYNFSGAFTVTDILDDDQFLAVPMLSTNGVSILSQSDNGSGSIQMITSGAHGYVTGDTAIISATTLALPLTTTSVLITKVISDTTFIIDVPVEPLGAYVIPVDMAVDGVLRDGSLMSHQDFTLYNASSVGGLSERDLNRTLFTVREVLTPDYFVFTTHTGFSKFIDRGGGSMRINSLTMGWRGTQSNDQATGSVYRPIALTGASYCFLRVPSLGRHSTIINTGPVTNILSKVQLTAPPVMTLFNTAVSGSLEFRDGPLPNLSMIDFQWVDKAGVELEFGHFQWSCVLEITTLNTVNNYNFQPVRVYVPDPVDQMELKRSARMLNP